MGSLKIQGLSAAPGRDPCKFKGLASTSQIGDPDADPLTARIFDVFRSTLDERRKGPYDCRMFPIILSAAVVAASGFHLAAAVVALPAIAATWCAVMASPTAVALAVAIVGAVVLVVDGAGAPPATPGYLERAPAPATVAAPAPVRMSVRFLPPVWAVEGARTTRRDLYLADIVDAAIDAARAAGDAVAEIDRLIACRERAVRSRHKARAAEYDARIAALVS
jgi:hypothetical protein